MNSTTNVLIVSVYDQNLWLALALARQGMRVTVLDLTHQLAAGFEPEDIEGPFGFLGNLEVVDERLWESQSHGMTFWLSDGPLEMSGPLSQFQFQRKKLLVSSLSQNLSEKDILKVPFRKSWLMHLSHSLSSNYFRWNAQSMSKEELKKQSKFLYFEKPFFIRREKDWGKSGVPRDSLKTWCTQRGVEIIDQKQLIGMIFSSDKIPSSIEIQETTSQNNYGSASTIISFEFLVWGLNSLETLALGGPFLELFFKKGVLRPEWIWSRFRMQLEDHFQVEALPDHFTMIEDLELPWCHENLVVVQKVKNSKFIFDSWVRIPYARSFEKNYLIEQGEKIRNQFQRRLADVPIRVEQIPKEGLSRFPLYERIKLESIQKKMRKKLFKNVLFDSSELWPSLGWNGILDFHKQMNEQVGVWWLKREKERLKKEEKMQKAFLKVQEKKKAQEKKEKQKEHLRD